MAFSLLDKDFIPEENLNLLLSNRGFLYGDGFFETLVIRNRRVFFLEDHCSRAVHAMNTLQLKGKDQWDSQRVFKSVQELWNKNEQAEQAIVKWMGWRNSGGLYAPDQEEHDFHSLWMLKPFREAPALKKSVRTISGITNRHSPYSGFKRLSALPYVLAGLEKKNMNCDEVILTDQAGNLSEALSSNLFWIEEDVLFTPALETGCINGILRRNILKHCSEMNITCKEVTTELPQLPSTATVFTGNVTGISVLEEIEGKKFNPSHTLIHKLQDSLFNPSSAQSL